MRGIKNHEQQTHAFVCVCVCVCSCVCATQGGGYREIFGEIFVLKSMNITYFH